MVEKVEVIDWKIRPRVKMEGPATHVDDACDEVDERSDTLAFVYIRAVGHQRRLHALILKPAVRSDLRTPFAKGSLAQTEI